jgi:hypothetical protein
MKKRLAIDDRVSTPNQQSGKIVQITKNGWYKICLDSGEHVNVRGLDNIRRSTSPIIGVALCDPYTTRSKRSTIAGLRRNQIVDYILRTSPVFVTPIDLRLVVADGKKDKLQYQTLDPSDSDVYTIPTTELDTLISESAHFAHAWEYVNHRDSARVRHITRQERKVIYLAIITFSQETRALFPDDAHFEHDQAYVGLTKQGIGDRWAWFTYNHMLSANAIMSTHEAGRKTMLVDACMRLHCSQGGKVWLFTIQHNPALSLAQEEERLIGYFKTYGSRGMNAKKH